MEYLIIVFTFAYIILAYKRIDWAVMLLIFGLPTYLIRFQVSGIPITVLELMILVSSSVWVIRHTKFFNFIGGKYSWQDVKANRQQRLPYPWRWEIILLLLISFVAVAVAGFSESALGIWKAYFFEPVLVFILVKNVFRRSDHGYPWSDLLNKILWPLALSALVVSLVAVYQRLTGQLAVAAFWPRVTGVYPYPNALGLYLGPIVLLMLGWWLENFRISNFEFRIKDFKNWFIVLVIFFSILSIFLAKSEGALAGIGVALLFFVGYLICCKLLKRPVIMKIGAGIFVIVMATALVYPLIALNVYPPYYYPDTGNKYLDYALDKLMLKDLSGEIRKQQWRETWAMMTTSPVRFLFGTGLDNYREAIAPFHQPGIFYNFENDPDFRRKIVWFDEKYKAEHWQPVEVYMYPHSFLLNYWTELGIFGSLLFIWIIIKFFITCFKNINRNWKLEIGNLENKRFNYILLGLAGAMVVMVVHGIVDVPYFKNDLAVMFWLFIAMMSLISLGDNEKVVVKK